jgi:tRNA (cmo5U34)-methyltransferase
VPQDSAKAAPPPGDDQMIVALRPNRASSQIASGWNRRREIVYVGAWAADEDSDDMSVATHLGIDLADYDAMIRTFIPDYETMLEAAAAAVPSHARVVVDLGTGTGALAARCLARVPGVRLVGIDADEQILDAARRRLGPGATFLRGSFRNTPVPRCDAVVASLSLHHIRTRPAKVALYRRLHEALRPGGIFINADSYPASARRLAQDQRASWTTHLRQSYTPSEARALFAGWAKEDVYLPLAVETELLQQSGFVTDVIWRKGVFAVIAATPRAASVRTAGRHESTKKRNRHRKS